jgi:acetoin utilization protein AcuB
MIVKDVMKSKVFTLTHNATIKEGLALLKQHSIHHIPIVDKDTRLEGIVSDRDFRDAAPSIFHSDEHLEDFEKPISTVMTKDIITAHPLDFVEELSAVFYEHRIGCIPIVEEDKLVGIITETDMLHTLIQLTGAHQPSSQIEVQVENVTGKLADVAAVIRQQKVNIISVLVYPGHVEGYKVLVFRLQTMNPNRVINTLTKEGFTILWPSFPGVFHE